MRNLLPILCKEGKWDKFSKIWSDLNLTAFSTFTQHTAQAITNLKMTNKRKT